MADALVVASIRIVLDKAVSVATDRIGLTFGLEEELENLRESAAMIQDILADAEEKRTKSRAVQRWLKRIEGIAFEVDNVLDELHYEFLRRKVKSQSQQIKENEVCFFFSFSCTNVPFRGRMASKVRDMNIKLESINQKANGFGLSFRHHIEAVLPDTMGAKISRQTDSVVAQTVVGRTKDESKIVEMLLSPSEKVVSVIPIIGMGGLGKTTLAKSVYNNSQVDGHFDKRIWVCVSEKIEVTELFKFILESLTRQKVGMDHRDAIVQAIREQLGEKKYFLVLDDVWNHEQTFWNDFFTTLEGLSAINGSWCLVTTRLEQAADTVSRHLMMNVGPYFLEKLSDDDCWSILKEKAFAGEVPQELEAIRELVIQRCNGLPLAATVIGGLLRIKRKEEWLLIMEKSLLSGDPNGVEQILKVSFDYLSPVSVKKCFAYCSMFPKDTRLERDLLIELWMAEGFLPPDFENETVMENIGEKYFTILLQSSLIEEVKEWGKTHYKMHDLVHDLAKSVLEPESNKFENDVLDNCNKCHYLTIKSFEEMTGNIIENISTSLRALYLESGISGDILSKFKYLRTLKLSGAVVKDLPASVGKLKCLRFLDLPNYGIETLPESICKLYNLQTLRIYGFRKGLPKRMSSLISLRHLHYLIFNASIQMPPELGRLTCLQTLEFFNIGKEKGHQIEELGTLKDLKGSLHIRNLELVKSKEEAKRARFCDKPNLFELKFQWGSVIREGDTCDDYVLKGLKPHPNLKKLEIRNFMGDQFPTWFINMSMLVELVLIDCKTCGELPRLGQLPYLQNLLFQGLNNIRCIGPSFYGIDGEGRGGTRESISCSGGGQVARAVMSSRKLFPALKTLSIHGTNNLVEWVDAHEVTIIAATGEAVDTFPMLEALYINGCSKLTSIPGHFPSLEKLDVKMYCHVSLVKKILSTTTGLSSLSLHGDKPGRHNNQHIRSLHLEKGQTLSLDGCGNLPSEILEHICHIPSIQHLKLHKCADLTGIRGCSTLLESLDLSHCDNLRELPEDLCQFQSLRTMVIDSCPKIVTFSEGDYNLTSLQDLKICHCNGLISLPIGLLESSCASLRHLSVHDCFNLISIPMLESLKKIPSLKSLDLSWCPDLMTNLMPKGFGFLTSLVVLDIGPFICSDSFGDEFDWSGLISSSTIRQLSLHGLPHIISLPDQLQYLTSLTGLSLFHFGIESLPDWFGNLVSLNMLSLQYCEKLQNLPSMAAVGCLTNLRYLHFDGCPLLYERCNPQSGPDSEWSKISHLPIKVIDNSLFFEMISQLRYSLVTE